MIPTPLRDAVIAVRGLDTRPHFRSLAVAARPARRADASHLSPQSLRSVYEADGLGRGTGQTIGIVSLARFHRDEVRLFDDRYGLDPPAVQTIRVGTKAPGTKGAIEVALDLEMAHAMAPGATVVNYETQNDADSIDQIVNRIVEDVDDPTAPHPSVVSISWGSCEAANADIATSENTYAAAERAGITIFVASGDNGPYDCTAQSDNPIYRIIGTVDYPSASAHTFAVGGTRLSTIAGSVYLDETAW